MPAILHSDDTPARELFLRLLREQVRPHAKRIGLAALYMSMAAAATAANAWMMQPVLDEIFIKRDHAMLHILPFAVVVIAAVNAFATYGHVLLMRYVGQRIVSDLQMRLFAHLMKSDLALFHDQAAGRLISRFTNDIALMRSAVSTLLTGIARESLTLIFLISVMLYQNLMLSFIALVVLPIGIFPLLRVGRNLRKLSLSTQHELGEFSARLDEVFQGVRTVKSYNREDYEIGKAHSIIERLFGLYLRASRLQAATSPMMEMISGVAIAGVIAYGGAQVLSGETTAGSFFSFVAALIMAYKPTKALASLNTALQEGLAAASRLFAVLDAEPAIHDRPGAQPLSVTRGHIRYENVSFAYAPEGAGVQNVTFDVPAGKKVALVGLSGGGKSTLINLLLRFYDAKQGRILIDGADIREVTLASLRGQMAFVPQETMLFDDSIRANIAYGRPDARESEIIAAAENAAADTFIQALPQGYDTVAGPHGVRLSGGQRQRIAIARAMLKNAPILLLDEATSSLDTESERAVQEALTRLMEGRTTLLIAHRFSTIMHADLIIVVEGGRVIESGTHTQLLALQGRYHSLYAQQAPI